MNELLKADFTKIISKHQKLNIKDFYATRGEIISITGDNGVGKTTFLKTLLGLSSYNKGNIHYLSNIKISSALDLKQLYEYLTGRQALKMQQILDNANSSKINNYIHIFQMDEYIDKKISTYSLGMKRRLLILNTLIVDADIYLLDEPTNGLSQNFLEILGELLNDIKNRNKTIIQDLIRQVTRK